MILALQVRTAFKRKNRVEVHDPLKEINLGEEGAYRPTYISKLITQSFKENLVKVLKEYKDCFARDYEEMA